MLSHLAYAARTYPDEFSLLVDAMDLQEAIVVIPEIILEESAGNHGMTPERYQAYYEPLFQQLSQSTDIYVVPFETAFQVIEHGAQTASEAFTQFQLMALLLNKGNAEIKPMIEVATDVAGIQAALTLHAKDAGERIIHLFTCAFLFDGVPTVRVYSNENRGVYNIRYLSSCDETLREILRFPTQTAFLTSYELESFDCILMRILQAKKAAWSPEQLLDFLNRYRIKSLKNRDVRFLLPPKFSDKRQVTNQELLTLFLSNEEFVLTF